MNRKQRKLEFIRYKNKIMSQGFAIIVSINFKRNFLKPDSYENYFEKIWYKLSRKYRIKAPLVNYEYSEKSISDNNTFGMIEIRIKYLLR